MKVFIAGACFGLILGVLLARSVEKPQNVSISNKKEDSSVNPEPLTVNQEVPSIDEPQYELLGVQKITTTLEIPSTSESDKVLTRPSVRTLSFTAHEIGHIESNIDEIRRDIALIREGSGWTVRFYSQPNFFSQMGFKNEDFIRYDQIEKMKNKLQDPDLISRLESVIRTLER